MKLPAKSQYEMRAVLARVVEHNLTPKEIMRLIERVEKQEGAYKAMQLWLSMMEYCLPKLARVEHTGHDGTELTVTLKGVLEDIGQREALLPDDSVIDVTPEE